jgi:hypothetical protein
MCGKTMPEPTAEIATDEDELAPPRSKEPSSPAPAYTGGIFNLGAPAETSSSRNLDYLLEDDEEPKSGKLWLLIVVALALVVGLGWLRWRNQGLPAIGSLIAGKTKSPAGAQNPDAPATSADTPASAPAPSSQPAPPPSPPPSSDTAGVPAATPPSSNTTASNAGSAPATAPSESTTGEHAPGATQPANPGADASTSAAAVPETAPAPPGTTSKSTDTTPAAAPESKPATRKPAPTLPPKPTPKSDPVILGEQYLYGRGGVSQNCERGLRYVKPAADQSNTKAMITMGALYATGHCLSRDLPTAYRYFALALRTDPENGPLRQNVDMVWKQMTAEERKQAIRLTQ